jgi:hypothetical protein
MSFVDGFGSEEESSIVGHDNMTLVFESIRSMYLEEKDVEDMDLSDADVFFALPRSVWIGTFHFRAILIDTLHLCVLERWRKRSDKNG